ncbi:NRDE protein-domain-containing protein [Rhypophila decipiens]|uniref:NRDE protein-domain-containing protein n=1 Tax=Rhypophila decipiens TaxID=261697 RepID=A0AAN7B8P3_9PEZI|nr:NRDE protein-domain-containing protein [Rhypophila decipiens]
MCIVLLTTSHPKYALIIIDNRDEYILRPTSRPHWWTATSETDPSVSIEVLSSRDLQRAEHGTWLGITKNGNFAVLTNYRETDTHDAAHPVAGKRSRGGMVTAWLGADPSETTEQFVKRLVNSGDVKGVGGFSLICGKLRKSPSQDSIEPLAIISNRADNSSQVPWICGARGKTYGLSNAIYIDPSTTTTSDDSSQQQIWPKVQIGSDLLSALANSDSATSQSEADLIDSLHKILDTDNFPPSREIDLEEGIPLLKDSIFIPAFGGKEHQDEMKAARSRGLKESEAEAEAAETLMIAARPDDGVDLDAAAAESHHHHHVHEYGEVPPNPGPNGFQTGLYGTQRQTVILVDWEGNVVFKERALYDANGNPIERGSQGGDMEFRFGIEGWEENYLDSSKKANGFANGNGHAI